MADFPIWLVAPSTQTLTTRLVENQLTRALLVAALTGSPEQVALLINPCSSHHGLLLVFANPDGTITSQVAETG